MKKTLKIFLFFLITILFSNSSFANENPKNLPNCNDNIKPNKWNNCYNYVKYGNNFEYSGTWKNGKFNGIGKIVDDLGNFEQGDFREGRFNWQWDYDPKKQLNGIIVESQFIFFIPLENISCNTTFRYPALFSGNGNLSDCNITEIRRFDILKPFLFCSLRRY